MHDDEVVLHALYDLAQAAHDLLIHTATPVPLALHTQLRHEHVFCFDTFRLLVQWSWLGPRPYNRMNE